MVAEVCLGRVGAVAAREVSRFARNSREWQQLVEVCRVVDTLLVDHENRAAFDELTLCGMPVEGELATSSSNTLTGGSMRIRSNAPKCLPARPSTLKTSTRR